MRTFQWAIVLALVSFGSVDAREEPLPRKAVAHHVTKINGTAVRYTSTVAEYVVSDPAARPGALVLTIAYTRDDVRDRARRPVIFAFNGGPGASSSPLHMEALGPVMRVPAGPDDRSNTALIDNAFSALDAADLVFIDPVSTGFSRALPGVDPRPWYDSRFDATTAAYVIERWLKENRRGDSPRFLMGESYGAMRAGLMVRYAPALRFDGVMLVSPSTSDATDSADAPVVNAVPSMAAGAWFHRRVDRRGLDSSEFFREATEFARTEYAAALAKGAALSSEEKRRIAGRLASFIGLPVDLILARDLRIDRNTYMFNLLKDQGLRTGLLDLRVTGPLAPNQDGAIDDPALNVIKPGSQTDTPPTLESVGAFPSPVVGRYVSERLKFPSSETYYGVNFLANSQWTFHPDDSTAKILAAAMKADGRLRLFVTSGYFDFGATDGTPFLAAGVVPERFTFLPLPGPHEVYDGEQNLAAFNDAVRAFVSRP